MSRCLSLRGRDASEGAVATEVTAATETTLAAVEGLDVRIDTVSPPPEGTKELPIPAEGGQPLEALNAPAPCTTP